MSGQRRRLSVEDLKVSFRGRRDYPSVIEVIGEISLEFTAGEMTVLIGPSGCGKTTFLNAVAGLIDEIQGRIRRLGDWSAFPPGVGYVFQTSALVPWLTIRQNAVFGASVNGTLDADTLERCEVLLHQFGLHGFEGAYPSTLSGGMQQRVAIIRGVLSRSKIILLDEPFANSDYFLRLELQRELSRLVSEEQLISILVTHDLEEAVRIADRVVVLTRRPTHVRNIIDIEIPRAQRLEDSEDLMTLLAPYLDRVWRSLRDGARND